MQTTAQLRATAGRCASTPRAASCPNTSLRVYRAQPCSQLSSPLAWGHPSEWRQQTRLRATPVAEIALAAEQVAEGVGVLGIGVGGVFVALWNIEKSNKALLEQQLQGVKDQLSAARHEVAQVQQQLASEQAARKEAESWKPRLDDAQKELFKLERALEMKDAQLATFMTTAHRQIKSLEDSVKELQKM